MIRLLLLSFTVFSSVAASAQHTHFAQFVIKGSLDSDQMKSVEQALTAMLDVVQARVGGSSNNVVLSSKLGTPILESEIQALITTLGFEVICYRGGVVGQDRILPLTQECGSKNVIGNIQD